MTERPETDPQDPEPPLDAPRPVDLLALAPHPDDAELLCGGTLLRAADAGHRTGVVDLTGGERGTHGDADLRGEEAGRAARILGLDVRVNAGLPDASLANDEESRRRLASIVRACRPRVVILPWRRGRHPDHRVASELGRDACYLAGLARFGEARHQGAGAEEPHRPRKLIYALSFREDPVKPTFVVDISEQFERKMEAIRAYGSQFDGRKAMGEVFPTGRSFYERVETANRQYGSLIRRPYGEPFWTEETMAVEDVVELPVRSM